MIGRPAGIREIIHHAFIGNRAVLEPDGKRSPSAPCSTCSRAWRRWRLESSPPERNARRGRPQLICLLTACPSKDRMRSCASGARDVRYRLIIGQVELPHPCCHPSPPGGMAGRELPDPFRGGVGIGCVQVCYEEQGLAVQRPVQILQREERLDLACEHEPPRRRGIVERLRCQNRPWQAGVSAPAHPRGRRQRCRSSRGRHPGPYRR